EHVRLDAGAALLPRVLVVLELPRLLERLVGDLDERARLDEVVVCGGDLVGRLGARRVGRGLGGVRAARGGERAEDDRARPPLDGRLDPAELRLLRDL